MSVVQSLRSGTHLFSRHSLAMFCVTAIPHLIGLLLLMLFVSTHPARTGSDFDPATAWRSMSVTGKLLTFALLPLNTWLPFAVGLAGVSWIIDRDSREQAPGQFELLETILRSFVSIAIPFFFLTFPWFVAFQIFIFPSVFVAWFIGFAPIAIATERAGWWRALKISSQVASRFPAATFTLWVLASVIAITIAVVRIIAIPNASLGWNVPTVGGLAFLVVTMAVFESIFDSALTVLYSQARMAQILAKPFSAAGTS